MSNPTISVPKHEVPHLDTRILTLREREGLKESLELNANIARATEDSYGVATEGATPVLPPGFNINKARMNEQAKNTLKVLKNDSPQELSAEERDVLAKEKKRIEEYLQKENALETFKEMHLTKRSQEGWHEAMVKAAKRPQYDPEIAKLKNINRLLEPDNAELEGLNYLRRAK